MVISALIIAKGRSYRLPQKNIKEFNGKPLFLWNVEKCLKLFDRVYVSSDSSQILTLAHQAGAIPICRSEGLGGDTPDIPVFQHALESMPETDAIVAVHANNPTLKEELIKKVKEELELGFVEVMTCHPMTHGDIYKEQANKVYGSIRGLTRDRLLTYPDPYKPQPEVLIVDESREIETQEDFDLCLLTQV